MHPTRSTSILISLAVVAACVAPVIARQKPVTPQVKTPSATHGPTATTNPDQQDPAKAKTATAPAKPAVSAPANTGAAKPGTAKAVEVKSNTPKATTQPAKTPDGTS